MPVPVPVQSVTEWGNLNKAKQGSLPDDREIMRNHSLHALVPQLHRTLRHTLPGELHPKDSQVAQGWGASMSLSGHGASTESLPPGTVPLPPLPTTSYTPIEWDWDVEHADRKREAKADAAVLDTQPFQLDRRVLRDILREKTHCEVGRINFLSSGKSPFDHIRAAPERPPSGTFHKAYLVTLADTRQLVVRVARRFMSRLKTQSEVATMQYLREKTSIPVPDVYFYDSNPYNRLGGEYILMSKASGIPLGRVYHSMSNEQLKILFKNVASLIIPLFAQRFSHIGSLHFPTLSRSVTSPVNSSSSTPTATHVQFKHFSLSAIPTPTAVHTARDPARATPASARVGPIVSWPFFGSGRGDLAHPSEIDRGPWSSTRSYLESCVQREIAGVKRESEGKSAPHRLHLDPDEIRSSRHHHLDAVPDDQSDDSDEWDAQESEEEWEGPGDSMYSDYRRMQRSTFLVAHIMRREQSARREMSRWMHVMDRLGAHAENSGPEEFGLDCHDLNLENVFVDECDHTKITCIIDWESTTTRPLWACAHLPAFVQTSPFTSKLFREVVASIALSKSSKNASQANLAAAAKEWLHYEAVGARLRLAHRCVEWDGWEEGLVDSILGPEECEEDWFKDAESTVEGSEVPSAPSYNDKGRAADDIDASGASEPSSLALRVAALKSQKQAGQLPLKKAREKEQTLTTTGDICGGRGGELGRRLEAWLSVNENGRRRGGYVQGESDAEAE